MPVDITGVAETLVLPLYLRVRESQRDDAIIKDEKSIAVVRHLDYDFTWIDRLPGIMSSQVAAAVRTEIFDDVAHRFLQQHPSSTIVNLGAGLCTRFYRLDNRQVCWVELDFEPVIAIRRRIFPDTERHISLACSALDFTWLEAITPPALFLAEGVLPYLQEEDIKRLMLQLCKHFPGSELVFDAINSFSMKAHRLDLSGVLQNNGLDSAIPHEITPFPVAQVRFSGHRLVLIQQRQRSAQVARIQRRFAQAHVRRISRHAFALLAFPRFLRFKHSQVTRLFASSFRRTRQITLPAGLHETGHRQDETNH